jgi:hypothetical protein
MSDSEKTISDPAAFPEFTSELIKQYRLVYDTATPIIDSAAPGEFTFTEMSDRVYKEVIKLNLMRAAVDHDLLVALIKYIMQQRLFSGQPRSVYKLDPDHPETNMS